MRVTPAGHLLVVGLMLGALDSPGAWAAPSSRTPSESDLAQQHFKDGLAHQRAKRYEAAIASYEQSLKHDGAQPEALNNLGFCHKELGRYQRAVSYYKDAIRLDRNLAEAYEYLGEAYLKMGKIDLAKQQYKKLLPIDAEVAEELGDKIEAALLGEESP